jgi:hypothetical protein
VKMSSRCNWCRFHVEQEVFTIRSVELLGYSIKTDDDNLKKCIYGLNLLLNIHLKTSYIFVLKSMLLSNVNSIIYVFLFIVHIICFYMFHICAKTYSVIAMESTLRRNKV